VKRIVSTLLLSLILIAGTASLALATPPRPASLTFVYDYADMLSGEEEESLHRLLSQVERATTAHVVIVTEESLGGNDVMWAAQNIFDAWGIGQKDKDNGFLIYVAEQDHKWRLHTGYGLEGALPDAYLYKAAESAMVPRFKDSDYYGGLAALLTEYVVPALEKEYNATITVPENIIKPAVPPETSTGASLLVVLAILVGPILLVLVVGIILKASGFSGGIVWGNGGNSDDSDDSGSSSSGGSDFGGGSSGGGGVSGGW
jgi:uncharacterized protein